jgi:uncharacterized protein
MKTILILSDTHGMPDKRAFRYFEACDEIWHAGDIGTAAVTDSLKKIKLLRAVYGNIDGTDIRKEFPEDLFFICEDVKVYMTHIGGYPGKYTARVKQKILTENPGLFICGHSHILKVMYDKALNCLHINPGAAGRYGFHKVLTMVRLQIDKGEMKNLEVIELGKREGFEITE